MNNVKTNITGRVHTSTKKAVRELATKRDVALNDIVKDAILDYLARQDDLEPSAALKQIFELKEEFRETQDKLHYYELENQRISESMMEHTFLDYVDSTLATLRMKLEPYYTEEEIHRRLKEHLEKFEDRAKFHDQHEAWQERYDNPEQFAQDKINRSMKEDSVDQRN